MDTVARSGGHQAEALARSLVFHSDRGSQYAATGIVALLVKQKIQQSISRRGNCWGQHHQRELLWLTEAGSTQPGQVLGPAQNQAVVFEYIEMFYNRQRPHSSIGYRTSVDMERALNHQPVSTPTGQGQDRL